MSKHQRIVLGITLGFLFVIFFCLTTKSYQGVDASNYPLIKTFSKVTVGNAKYQLVKQSYNPKTNYVEFRFMRTSSYAEINKPKISAEFTLYKGETKRANTKNISNDFILVQIKSIPANFTLGKIIIKEKSLDDLEEESKTYESDPIYFSEDSLEKDNKLKSMSKSQYEKENIKIRIQLLERKISKKGKQIHALQKNNKEAKAYLKELQDEKDLLIGSDKEELENKIQTVQAEYTEIAEEIKTNQDYVKTYKKQKQKYQDQLNVTD